MAEPGQAQSPQACARIESDLERLICYDALFRPSPQAKPTGKGNRADAESTTSSSIASNASRKTGLPAGNGGKGDRGGGRFVPNVASKSGKSDASKPIPGKSVWASGFTGDGGHLLRSRSKKQHRNIIGQQAWMELVVKCEIDTTSLAVTFGGNIVASVLDKFKITMQVDGNPAKATTFTVSKDFKAVGLWKGATAIPVIKTLLAGQNLQVTGAPFFSRAVTATFPIAGLDAAIKPLRESCGW